MQAANAAADAPSVLSPEIAIPSAGISASLQSRPSLMVLGPESFRGGCSFGIDEFDSPIKVAQRLR